MNKITPQSGFAIITGAGSELGAAMAAELLRAGFTVVGTEPHLSLLNETQAALGDAFQSVALDITDPQAVSRVFAERVQINGPLAILINNAAIHPHRDFLEETPESFGKTMQFNFGGALNCSHAALQNMATCGAGRILTLSSYAYLHPQSCSAAYSVSRGAARILTQAMIADLNDRFPGIVINEWIPDGVPLGQAGQWGAKLAQMADPGLTGSLFEMGTEVLPPRGVKGKIKDILLMRRRKPRQI